MLCLARFSEENKRLDTCVIRWVAMALIIAMFSRRARGDGREIRTQSYPSELNLKLKTDSNVEGVLNIYIPIHRFFKPFFKQG